MLKNGVLMPACQTVKLHSENPQCWKLRFVCHYAKCFWLLCII